jgi:hypothetical protein
MGFFMPAVNRAEILITYIIYILNEQNKEYMHKHSPLNCLAKHVRRGTKYKILSVTDYLLFKRFPRFSTLKQDLGYHTIVKNYLLNNKISNLCMKQRLLKC